jgi:hypothetical protein
MQMRVDFSNRTGAIKPLHGVNNGPLCYGSKVDVSRSYKEAGIPWVRLHDPNWPYPQEVDIHTIFPDFENGDPDNPDDYDFERTDLYVRSVLDTGAKIVYRLGESIEHEKRRFCTVPPDARKWAMICRGIVNHYNNGWANGFHWNIQYWEIWNEAEWEKMWPGTPEQFYSLYEETATTLKKLDPELRVGGYACGSGVFTPFTDGFLAYCRDRRLPLDFFSWHAYREHPAQVVSMALRVRSMLEAYGFAEAESHCNEWNYMKLPPGKRWVDLWDDPYIKQDVLERAKGAEGASYTTAVLLALQDAGVDAANYYDGQPSSIFCGLFNYYGVPQPTYDAFALLDQLYRMRNRIGVEWEHGQDDLYVCAAIEEQEKRAMVVITNFGTTEREMGVQIDHLPDPSQWAVEQATIREGHRLRPVHTQRLPQGTYRCTLRPYETVRLALVRAGEGMA